MSTLANLKYGYDRASNRKYRRDEVSRVQSTPKYFDELYGYDELNRLTSFARGELNVGNTTISSPTLGQTWTLDPTGNWPGFTQTEIDPLTQTRTHNVVNEIDGIGESVGDEWPTPAHDANGNTTSFPDPRDLESGLTATYDAWNRLVKLENGSGTVAEYEYDGLNRRTTKTTASETRHAYFSDRWQVLEERVDSSTDAERQFLWGERYVDDLVLRDRDTDGNGTLDERLYALCDGLFNVVALTDETGDVKERFAYQPYGLSQALNPNFTTYSGTDYEWEYRFTGRELDLESGLQINRNRYLHLELGRWVTRDPIGYWGGMNVFGYVISSPVNYADPTGQAWWSWIPIVSTIMECAFNPPGGHIGDYGSVGLSCIDCRRDRIQTEKHCRDAVFRLLTQYITDYMGPSVAIGVVEGAVGVGISLISLPAGIVILIDTTIRAGCVVDNLYDMKEAAEAAANRYCKCP